MKNYYEVVGDVIHIRLDRKDGSHAWTKVSARHLEKLSKINVKWCALDQGRASMYVSAIYRCNGKKQTLRLHRVITDAPRGLVVNHINGDGLDNTDDNLEVVTNQVNAIKRVFPNSNNTSGIRGVSYSKERKKWEVKFKKSGVTHHFGRYRDKEEAVMVAATAFQDLFEGAWH